MKQDQERAILAAHVRGLDGACAGCRAWWLPFRNRPTIDPPRQSALTLVYCARLVEIGQRMDGREDPGLLAVPTSASGALDPTALYERLAALDDRPVWRWDLTQALLRLPVGVDEALATISPSSSRMAMISSKETAQTSSWSRDSRLPSMSR